MRKNPRFRVIQTSVGCRIYDYKIYDILKVKGDWYLSDYDNASVLCASLNGLEEADDSK